MLRYKPDLLVWQIGTNDVVWRGIADDAKEMLSNSVKRLKAEKMDVVLLDLQYAPLVLATSRYIRMEKIIAEVAGEQNVGRFPRFLLMKRASEAGSQRPGRGRPPQLRRRLTDASDSRSRKSLTLPRGSGLCIGPRNRCALYGRLTPPLIQISLPSAISA